MTSAKFPHFVGWSAFVSAIATVLGAIALIMFFTLGEPWGTINDISSIVLALSALPVLLVLHELHRRDAPTLSLVVFVIGILTMLAAVALQTRLIMTMFGFTPIEGILGASNVAFGLFGVPLMVYGYLARANGLLPRRLALLGILAGAGYVTVCTGFLLGGPQHPLTSIGGLAALIFYPIWAVWLGRLFLSDRLTASA